MPEANDKSSALASGVFSHLWKHGLSPAACAERLMHGVERGEFYVLTTPPGAGDPDQQPYARRYRSIAAGAPPIPAKNLSPALAAALGTAAKL